MKVLEELERQLDEAGISTVLFDMDGVLVDHISSWVYLIETMDPARVSDEPYRLYQAGKMTQQELVEHDIRIYQELQPRLTITEVDEMIRHIPLMDGIDECLSVLRERGYDLGIISGGLDRAAMWLGTLYEFNSRLIYANQLGFDRDGRLTGSGHIVVDLAAKGEVVKKILRTEGLRVSETASVGNSASDVSMFEATGLGIAFDPLDDVVRGGADIVLESRDLRDLLPVLEPTGIRR